MDIVASAPLFMLSAALSLWKRRSSAGSCGFGCTSGPPNNCGDFLDCGPGCGTCGGTGGGGGGGAGGGAGGGWEEEPAPLLLAPSTRLVFGLL
eukprot:6446074-Prymnesium_polylepis.1